MKLIAKLELCPGNYQTLRKMGDHEIGSILQGANLSIHNPTHKIKVRLPCKI